MLLERRLVRDHAPVLECGGEQGTAVARDTALDWSGAFIKDEFRIWKD